MVCARPKKLTNIPPDKNHDDDDSKRHRVFHERVHAARRFIVRGHESFSITTLIGNLERERTSRTLLKLRASAQGVAVELPRRRIVH